MLYISNIVLDYNNIYGGFMKKIVVPVFFITFVVILAAIGIFQTGVNRISNSNSEYIFVGIIVVLFIVGIVLSIKRYISAKQGLPEEDEMSTKIVNRAASISYFLSLILWLVIIFLNTTTTLNTGIIVGYGIIGMVVIFVLNLVYFQFRGVND